MRLEKTRSAVMFEPLGSGKPFVGTKVGGESEIITSDGYVLLYDSANSKEVGRKDFDCIG